MRRRNQDLERLQQQPSILNSTFPSSTSQQLPIPDSPDTTRYHTAFSSPSSICVINQMAGSKLLIWWQQAHGWQGGRSSLQSIPVISQVLRAAGGSMALALFSWTWAWSMHHVSSRGRGARRGQSRFDSQPPDSSAKQQQPPLSSAAAAATTSSE